MLFRSTKVLNLANTEPAVTDGTFFDLMYANPASDHFYPFSNYAFLRRKDDSLLLVAVNFGGAPANVSIRIPAHAFDFMQIAEKKVTAVDLLSNDKLSVVLAKDGYVDMCIEGYGARVWKMTI